MGTEPLKALGVFRSGRVLGWNARDSYKRELMFGWNLVRACGLTLFPQMNYVWLGLCEFGCGRTLGWNACDSYKRELMWGWNLRVRACGLYV